MKDNKVVRISLDIILIILGIIFLVFGIRDFKDKINESKLGDNEKFKKEFSYVSKDNIYKYITLKDLTKILENGDYIILIGNKKDSWTQILVSPLNDVVKSNKIKNIYYLDINSIDKNDKNYNKLLSKLKLKKLEVPIIIFTNDGKIKTVISKDIYDSDYDDAPIEYWSSDKLKTFNKLINNNIKLIQE